MQAAYATDADEVNVQVRAEDQAKINEFSRNNARLVELKYELKEKKQTLETLSDAAEEVGLADDDEKGSIKLRVGESYIDVSEDAAESYLEREIEKLEAKVAEEAGLIGVLEKRQGILKQALYDRFGKAINLEA